jgi:DNA primase
MPLAWKDLRAPSAPEFSVRGPLPRGADPWKRMASVRQSLTAAVRRRMNLPPK